MAVNDERVREITNKIDELIAAGLSGFTVDFAHYNTHTDDHGFTRHIYSSCRIPAGEALVDVSDLATPAVRALCEAIRLYAKPGDEVLVPDVPAGASWSDRGGRASWVVDYDFVNQIDRLSIHVMTRT